MKSIKIYSDFMIERFYRKSNIVQLCEVRLDNGLFYILYCYDGNNFHISLSLDKEIIINDEDGVKYKKILEIRDNEKYDENMKYNKVFEVLLDKEENIEIMIEKL